MSELKVSELTLVKYFPTGLRQMKASSIIARLEQDRMEGKVNLREGWSKIECKETQNH